jgi:4-oxalocrotonate tautomerase family enzyme
MPLVNVRLIEGVFTPEQKREMIHQLTETMVDIEGETWTAQPGAGRSFAGGR